MKFTHNGMAAPQEIHLLLCVTPGEYAAPDVETVLAPFHDRADAERTAAELTAMLKPGERPLYSYRVDTLTIVQSGAPYTGGRFE